MFHIPTLVIIFVTSLSSAQAMPWGKGGRDFFKNVKKQAQAVMKSEANWQIERIENALEKETNRILQKRSTSQDIEETNSILQKLDPKIRSTSQDIDENWDKFEENFRRFIDVYPNKNIHNEKNDLGDKDQPINLSDLQTKNVLIKTICTYMHSAKSGLVDKTYEGLAEFISYMQKIDKLRAQQKIDDIYEMLSLNDSIQLPTDEKSSS